VMTLWSQAGPGIHLRRSDGPEEIAKKIQRDADLFLVAEVGGEIVGTVLGGFDGRRGMIYHLAVAASFRQHGIGEALMEELEQRLRAKGCIRYYLLVTKDNTDAVRFYEARGWKQMDDLFLFGKDIS
jgi:ribosomal protein S18 acetylase RimI-like enzyme